MVKIERSISELEQSIKMPELPASMSNSIEVVDGSISAVYRGTFSNFRQSEGTTRWSISYVVGSVRLEKIVHEPHTTTEKKMVKLFPPRFEYVSTKSSSEKRIWQTNLPLQVIFSNGNTSLSYRANLQREIALNAQVKVSNELMEMVFGPLDKQIQDWYRQMEELLTPK